MRGWAVSPVIGSGLSPESAIISKVGAAVHPEGSRIENVIGNTDRCLVAFDVPDLAQITDNGGVLLGDLAQIDGDELALPVARRLVLRRLAQDLGVGDRGPIRLVMRRIGRAMLGAQFHEGIHLGDSLAPPSGSFASDTFTDTTGVLLENHTPDLGGPVTRMEGSSSGVITANGRLIANGTSLSTYRYAGAPAGPDQIVAADLFVASAGEFANGVTARAATGAGTYNFLDHYSTANQWRLFKVIASAYTSLGSYSQTLTVGNTYALTLEALDAGKKGYVGGVERISSADNAITAAGSAGVRPYGGGSNTTGLQLDNFTATDAGGGTPHEQDVDDTTAVGDQQAKAIGAGRADQAAAADVHSRAVGKAQADAAEATDTRSVTVGRAQADAAQAADEASTSTAYRRTIADGVHAADQVSTGAATEWTLSIDDGLQVGDQQGTAWQAVRTHTEAVLANDTTAKATAVTRADGLQAADGLGRTWAISRAVSDQAGVGDVVVPSGGAPAPVLAYPLTARRLDGPSVAGRLDGPTQARPI